MRSWVTPLDGGGTYIVVRESGCIVNSGGKLDGSQVVCKGCIANPLVLGGMSQLGRPLSLEWMERVKRR